MCSVSRNLPDFNRIEGQASAPGSHAIGSGSRMNNAQEKTALPFDRAVQRQRLNQPGGREQNQAALRAQLSSASASPMY